MNPYRGIADRMTPERAQKMAARQTVFERNAVPLFADQVPATTADSFLVSARDAAENWERLDRKFVRSARLMRHLVGRRVGAEQLAGIDEKLANRHWLPKTPVCIADFWRQELARLIGRVRAGVNPVIFARKVERARRERLTSAWQAPE